MTVGFTTAAALTIGSSQVKSVLGLTGSANAFLESWIRVFTRYHETRLWDAVLGVVTMIALLVLKVKQGNRKKPSISILLTIFILVVIVTEFEV